MNFRRVRKIFKKDALDLFRSKGRLMAIFLFPMLMIFFFGAGLGGQISGINIIVVTEDNPSHDAQIFENVMAHSGSEAELFNVTIDDQISRYEAKEKVEMGKYDALVFVPKNFAFNTGSITQGGIPTQTESENIGVLVDPTTSQQARSAVLNGIQSIVSRIQGGSPPVEVSGDYGDLDYIDFLAPAIIVLTIFFGASQGTGRALAGEKEEGTLDRLAMTPASANDIIAGKTSYAVATQLIRAAIIILAVSLLFSVAMNGSWALVGLIIFLLTIASVGIGLALSALAEDESTYAQTSMMIILPAMFVSGIFFPVAAMPAWVQPIAYAYPLTYANNAIRQVMLMGTGLGGIAHNLLILGGFAIGLYLLGTWLFNRTARA